MTNKENTPSKSAIETARRKQKIKDGHLKFVSLTLPTEVLIDLDAIASNFIINRKPSRPEAIKQLIKFYLDNNGLIKEKENKETS